MLEGFKDGSGKQDLKDAGASNSGHADAVVTCCSAGDIDNVDVTNLCDVANKEDNNVFVGSKIGILFIWYL